MIAFLILAFQTYRQAQENGAHYGALTFRGVPQLAVVIATGREACGVLPSSPSIPILQNPLASKDKNRSQRADADESIDRHRRRQTDAGEIHC
jgi:hypothetical protein